MEKRRRREDKAPYLTKRILVSEARKAGLIAQQRTMEVMGYLVVAQDGWVIKKYADGSIEQIKPIARPENLKVVFD